MAQFKTIVVAQIDNGSGNIETIEMVPGADACLYAFPTDAATRLTLKSLMPGDTIRIVETETEVE